MLAGALVLAIMPLSAESFPFLDRLASTRASRRLNNCPISILGSETAAPAILSAHSLTTALEGLWEDRVADSDPDERNDYESTLWLNLDPDLNPKNDNRTSSSCSSDSDQEENATFTLPLYPLNEVYLPMSIASTAPDSIVNHTLNNVEPQNIKMALDLLSETTITPRFCVVLRAMDTGRIASVGNILRIVDADVQKLANCDDNDSTTKDQKDIDKIIRIHLTCQSEGLAEIMEIENGSGWGEKRLLRSDEYLRSRLRPLLSVDDDENDNVNYWQAAYRAIREDIRTIKLIYQLQLGSDDYPPDTLLRLGNEIRNFPELDAVADDGDSLLWKLAQEWQSVCMTLRQGRQALLATERNERMVDAAISKGGPLKLPIHLSDLDPEARWEIKELDQEFQLEHEESGMDPTLDFQVLIGLPTTNRRFGFLSKLVARERYRLENIASSSSRGS